MPPYSYSADFVSNPGAGAEEAAPIRELILRDLPGFTSMFERSTPAERVHAHFKQNPLLPAILIMDGDSLVGMLPRSVFFQLLSRPHGVDVYSRRPIALMLEHGNVETAPLSPNLSVSAAIDWCLTRPGEQIYEPVVVSKGNSHKIVHFHELIIAQSTLLEETMRKLEEQHDLLKEKNREILDSIHYAERIQKSMLQINVQRDCPGLNTFFLFRPRDIVSGDFYWLAQTENLIYVAAVDCTGHGVPGAFMSLLGMNYLEDIIRSKGIREPDVILATLHEKIRRSLNQSNEPKTVRDGMDVCLCAIDPDNRTLTFSGAKRPLYYTTSEGELTVLKGDRFSIGGIQREERRTFTRHTLEMKSGQTFYLTTDGYTDQPSEGNEKFGSLTLKSILKEIAVLPLTEKEKRLETALNQHQANTAQRDDITLVGVEWTRF